MKRLALIASCILGLAALSYAITVNPASNVTADSDATANTIILRDASGNFNTLGVTATDVTVTNTLTAGAVVVPGSAVISSTATTFQKNVGIGTASPASKLHMSSGTLTVDGTGGAITTTGTITFQTGTAATTAQGIVYANLVSSTVAANIGDHVLYTYTLPGNAISGNGRGIRIRAWGTTAGNANNKTVFMKVGTQSVFTTGVQTTNLGNWFMEAQVFRGSGTTLSSGYSWGTMTALTTTSPFSPTWQAPGNSCTSDIIITIQATTGSASADILGKGVIIELL
jgi:hypothetical protein